MSDVLSLIHTGGVQGAHHGVQELLGGVDRENDRVAAAAHILGDLDEFTAVVLLEIEEENLPFVDDLFGSDEVLIHSLSGVLVHHIYWLVAVFVGEMRASTWLGICPSNDDCGHFPRKIEDA